MGAAQTPEEQAIDDATAEWRKLPATAARVNQVTAILAHEGAQFDADGLTRALQTWIALDEATEPILDVVQWMTANKMWPFDIEES